MHSISPEKEHLKQSSFFVKEHQEKERTLNASYEKFFTSLYWLCKEEIAVSKAVSLFDLHKMLGVSDIASFTTRSPATIRSMIIELSDIIKKELVKKIKESKGYACLIDEVTDISNVQNLLTFIRFYGMEKGMTVSKFVNKCDIFREYQTTSADALSIFLCLKNVF